MNYFENVAHKIAAHTNDYQIVKYQSLYLYIQSAQLARM